MKPLSYKNLTAHACRKRARSGRGEDNTTSASENKGHLAIVAQKQPPACCNPQHSTHLEYSRASVYFLLLITTTSQAQRLSSRIVYFQVSSSE